MYRISKSRVITKIIENIKQQNFIEAADLLREFSFYENSDRSGFVNGCLDDSFFTDKCQKEIIFFMHIHKAAGNSIYDMFTDVFGNENVCPHRFEYLLPKFNPNYLGRFSFIGGHISFPTICKMFKEPRMFTFLRDPAIRLYSAYNHWKSNAQNASHVIFWQKIDQMSFLDFLKSEDPQIVKARVNVQARLLAGGAFGKYYTSRVEIYGPYNLNGSLLCDEKILETAVKNLNLFSVVGIVEAMNISIERINSVFGLRLQSIRHSNRGKYLTRFSELNEEVKNEIEKSIYLDRIIYNIASERLLSRKSSQNRKEVSQL